LVKFYHARNPCTCLEKLFREGEKKAKAMKEMEQQQQKTILECPSSTAESEGEEEKSEYYCEEINDSSSNRNDSGLGYWKSSLSENVWENNMNQAEISPTQSSLN
jgi:hypothetical protein